MADLDKYLNKIHVQEVEPFLMSLAILGTTAGVINAINLTYRTYKEYLTKAGRACSDLTERERSICMLDYKIKGKKQQLLNLQKLIAKCSRAKEAKQATKCKLKIKKEMQKIKDEIKRMQQRAKAIHSDYKKQKSFVRKIAA